MKRLALPLLLAACGGASFAGVDSGLDGSSEDAAGPVREAGLEVPRDASSSSDRHVDAPVDAGADVPELDARDEVLVDAQDAGDASGCTGFDTWTIAPSQCLYVSQGTFLEEDDAGQPTSCTPLHVNSDTCIIFQGRGVTPRVVYVSAPSSGQYRMLRDVCPEPGCATL